MLIMTVGSFSVNSFVRGSIKVPATSKTIAPNKDKYADISKLCIIEKYCLGRSSLLIWHSLEYPYKKGRNLNHDNFLLSLQMPEI